MASVLNGVEILPKISIAYSRVHERYRQMPPCSGNFFAAQWKNDLWHWAAVVQQSNHHKNNLYLLSGTVNRIIGH